jgi:hypothetical protein
MDAKLATLETNTKTTIGKPIGEEEDDVMSMQNICFIPKAWAANFLAPMSPWNALKVYRRLLETIPPELKEGFDFVSSCWLTIACTHEAAGDDFILKAKWQSPPAERRMIAWMQQRTRYLNTMPVEGFAGGGPGMTLNPQECFNKALEMVAALRPPSEATSTKR